MLFEVEEEGGPIRRTDPMGMDPLMHRGHSVEQRGPRQRSQRGPLVSEGHKEKRSSAAAAATVHHKSHQSSQS